MGSAELWVAVAFVIFVAMVVRAGAPKAMLGALDARGERIRAELEEARRLKEEAQKLVAEYRRRQREAEAEAETIITTAKAEAERLAAEANTKLEDLVARRTRLAEQKIALAEAQAVADVRAAAADAAVSAAGHLLATGITGPAANALLDSALKDVKTKLN